MTKKEKKYSFPYLTRKSYSILSSTVHDAPFMEELNALIHTQTSEGRITNLKGFALCLGRKTDFIRIKENSLCM